MKLTRNLFGNHLVKLSANLYVNSPEDHQEILTENLLKNIWWY